MKLSHEELEEVLEALSQHCKARFVSFRHGPIIDLDAWRLTKQQENKK